MGAAARVQAQRARGSKARAEGWGAPSKTNCPRNVHDCERAPLPERATAATRTQRGDRRGAQARARARAQARAGVQWRHPTKIDARARVDGQGGVRARVRVMRLDLEARGLRARRNGVSTPWCLRGGARGVSAGPVVYARLSAGSDAHGQVGRPGTVDLPRPAGARFFFEVPAADGLG